MRIWVKARIPNNKPLTIIVNGQKKNIYNADVLCLDESIINKMPSYFTKVEMPYVKPEKKIKEISVVKEIIEEPKEEDVIEEIDYDSYNYRELQAIAKSMGIPSSGKKAELIERIKTAEGKN